ncbi:MAG: aldo/keto reductase [Thermaerobacter sp.]|nr:aldo/keto reductase [Thermaerobacter sp.]
MIPTTTLGNTGLSVSRLCLGTMTFGNQADTATSLAILDKAFAAGVRFIDTADVYPLGGGLPLQGATEEILGQWLKGHRHEVVLASKCYGATGSGPNDRGLSRRHIMSAIENSLRRLQTDYLDLYQAHQFDSNTPVEETLRAFDDLVRQGKVRYIGVSNWRTWQLARGTAAVERNGLYPIISVQPRYNLLFRMIEEDLVPFCVANGLGLITYNPLAGGLLTGRYQPHQAVPDGTRFGLAAGAGQLYQARYWSPAHFAAVERFREYCADRHLSLAAAAVAWVLAQPGITSAIIGASRPDQLDASLQAADVTLTPSDLDTLDQLWWTLPRRYEAR